MGKSVHGVAKESKNKNIPKIMKKEWNDVREFHEKFGHPVAEQPVMIARDATTAVRIWGSQLY